MLPLRCRTCSLEVELVLAVSPNLFNRSKKSTKSKGFIQQIKFKIENPTNSILIF